LDLLTTIDREIFPDAAQEGGFVIRKPMSLQDMGGHQQRSKANDPED